MLLPPELDRDGFGPGTAKSDVDRNLDEVSAAAHCGSGAGGRFGVGGSCFVMDRVFAVADATGKLEVLAIVGVAEVKDEDADVRTDSD